MQVGATTGNGMVRLPTSVRKTLPFARRSLCTFRCSLFATHVSCDASLIVPVLNSQPHLDSRSQSD
jgi:hypothetical protein